MLEKRKEYIQHKWKVALRQPPWGRIMKSPISAEELLRLKLPIKDTGNEAFYAEVFDWEVGGKASVESHVDIMNNWGCVQKLNGDLCEALGAERTLAAFALMKLRLLRARHIILRRCASMVTSQDDNALVWKKRLFVACCVIFPLYNKNWRWSVCFSVRWFLDLSAGTRLRLTSWREL